MKTSNAVVCSVLLMVHSVALPACPKPERVGDARVYKFEDGSIGMRTGLNVNPDGTAGSYTIGDHGFTYIANGLSLWDGRNRVDCRLRGADCRTKFVNDAEAKDFGPGTQEFCVFAMEVDPPQGKTATFCGGERKVIGNGKGHPRLGNSLETETGASLVSYIDYSFDA